VTKQLPIGSRGFTAKQLGGLNCWHGRFENEIRRVYPRSGVGSQPMLDGSGLCQAVVIAGYILTYKVTLLPDSHSQ